MPNEQPANLSDRWRRTGRARVEDLRLREQFSKLLTKHPAVLAGGTTEGDVSGGLLLIQPEIGIPRGPGGSDVFNQGQLPVILAGASQNWGATDLTVPPARTSREWVARPPGLTGRPGWLVGARRPAGYAGGHPRID